MLPLSWSFSDWRRACGVTVAGMLFGMAIWWTSPMFTGHVEPWDAGGRYYLGALFFAGFVAAMFLPKAFWVAPIGVYVGQILYGVYLCNPDELTFWPLRMTLAVVECLAALAGALTCAILMGGVHLCVAACGFVLRLRKQANPTE
jgi:hypothetical protein